VVSVISGENGLRSKFAVRRTTSIYKASMPSLVRCSIAYNNLNNNSEQQTSALFSSHQYSMAKLSVLVVGGGIAGSVLAYWLAKGGAEVLVIERSSGSLDKGQGIDIEGPPREVIRRMGHGYLEEIQARSTGETGFACLDDNGKIRATIPGLLTSDIEIMRGDLTDVLTKAANTFDAVTFQYGCSIVAMEQDDAGVTVTFNDSDRSRRTFDVVLGADGSRSKTRQLMFGSAKSDAAIKPLDVYSAFFSIPRGDDTMYATIQPATGCRQTVIRPMSKETSSAFLSAVGKGATAQLEQVQREGDREAQKKALYHMFSDIGGQAPRIIEGLLDTKNFYFERISQVKLEHWSSGRVALCGDAGYCPSPLTGQGTNLAIIGSYVLAGELTSSPNDPTKAFQAYEKRLRGYVEEKQQIPLGGRAPFLVHPKTAWGVWMLRAFFSLIAWSGLWKLFEGKDLRPKDYKFPDWMPVYAHYED